MGCLQSKGATSSPQTHLEKLKLGYGYDKGEKSVDFTQQTLKGSGDHVKHNAAISAGGGGGGGGGVGRKISKESEGRKHDGGITSQRVSVKKIAAEDLVNGWPKWLVENVPKDALTGLVPKTADSYDKLAKVGKGTYSNVYKARDKSTGKIVALKKVRFDTSEPESVKFMAREIIVLKKLDHPNIIKLEGIATSRMQYSLYLVFDFMPSDLTKVISRPEGRLTEPQAKCYMKQLLEGLQHCHDEGILHRDIKGSNLLIDKNGVLKIADFGLANFYKNKRKGAMTSRVVTLWYRAPELLLGSTDYGVGIDLWSAGCLLAEMFVGRPIMPGRNEIEQLHRIFKLCGSPSEDYWNKVKPETTFRPPHKYSPKFRETFPYIPDSALSLMERLLAIDPMFRGTAESALQDDFFTTHPLPCEPSGLSVISTEEDEPIKSMDRKRLKNACPKPNGREMHKHHKRRVSFVEHIEEYIAYSREDISTAKKSQVQEQEGFDSSTGTTSSSGKQGGNQENVPRLSTPAFGSQPTRSAITEAHPNALKNIQNYPLLMASLTEAAHDLEESNPRLHRRSISNIDYRNLDIEKISKLFGIVEN